MSAANVGWKVPHPCYRNTCTFWYIGSFMTKKFHKVETFQHDETFTNDYCKYFWVSRWISLKISKYPLPIIWPGLEKTAFLSSVESSWTYTCSVPIYPAASHSGQKLLPAFTWVFGVGGERVKKVRGKCIVVPILYRTGQILSLPVQHTPI